MGGIFQKKIPTVGRDHDATRNVAAWARCTGFPRGCNDYSLVCWGKM